MQRFLANLHAQFLRNKTERDEKSWEWLKKEKLKKRDGSRPGTENGYSLKFRVDKEELSPACRICGYRDETVADDNNKQKQQFIYPHNNKELTKTRLNGYVPLNCYH